MSCDILTAVTLKINVFRDMTTCSTAFRYHRLGNMSCFQLRCEKEYQATQHTTENTTIFIVTAIRTSGLT
jgi:hypothetical protein